MKKEISQILKLAESYGSYTAENLANLVRIKSLSGREKDAAFELKRQMQEARLDEVHIDPLGNVIGRLGDGEKILAIDGHIDTVDQGNLENWQFPPFSGHIADGFVHGRGSADQKGGVVAMVTAGRILKEIGINKDLTLYFVGSVMEEDCDGLCWKYIIEEDKIRPDLVIITEPTHNGIYRGQRGRMEIDISFQGISAHGSAPERGDNAIYYAARICLEIEKLNEKMETDDFLGKGSITVSEFVSGSPSLCAVADFAKIHLDRRLTWGETRESALAQIEELVKDLKTKVEVLSYREKSFTGLEYGMEKYYPTWKMTENHPFIKTAGECFFQLFKEKPRIDKWTFSTNGVVINGIYQIPVIGFGPGHEIQAHAPNEKVPICDLIRASAFYALLARKVFA